MAKVKRLQGAGGSVQTSRETRIGPGLCVSAACWGKFCSKILSFCPLRFSGSVKYREPETVIMKSVHETHCKISENSPKNPPKNLPLYLHRITSRLFNRQNIPFILTWNKRFERFTFSSAKTTVRRINKYPLVSCFFNTKHLNDQSDTNYKWPLEKMLNWIIVACS